MTPLRRLLAATTLCLLLPRATAFGADFDVDTEAHLSAFDFAQCLFGTLEGTADGMTPIDVPAALADDGAVIARGDLPCQSRGRARRHPAPGRDDLLRDVGTQACVAEAIEGGCDDGDPATRDDACMAGTCAGTSFTCPEGDCIASATPNGSDCDIIYRDAGADCDDGQVGTRGDACDAEGACVGVAYACTPSACEASSVPDGEGCVATPRAVGTPCDDGDPCRVDDRCDGAGVCTGAAPRCPVGERCDAGACTTLVCEACEDDGDCAGATCAMLDGASRCLAPCDEADDCGEGATCESREGGVSVCVPADGCVTVVEPGPEAEVEPGPEAEVEVEPGPEAEVEPAPDASADASETDASADPKPSSRSDGGCRGGASELPGIAFAVSVAGAWLARRRRLAPRSER